MPKLTPGERKLTLDDVIDRLNEERVVHRADVHPSTLRARVWVGMAALNGGYMPHAYAYSRTRRGAADGVGYYLPRRKAASLRAGGVIVHRGDVYETYAMYVSDLVGR